jgi:hypothetical protein
LRSSCRRTSCVMFASDAGMVPVMLFCSRYICVMCPPPAHPTSLHAQGSSRLSLHTGAHDGPPVPSYRSCQALHSAAGSPADAPVHAVVAAASAWAATSRVVAARSTDIAQYYRLSTGAPAGYDT